MRLAERLLYNMQQNIDSVIDLKFAVQVVSAVWEQVEARVIKNCFRTAGFIFNDSEKPVPLVDNPDKPEFWEAVEKAFGSEDFSDYVNIDVDVVSTEQLTD
ncbi:unnamed protein product [Ixodes persulcatus]